MINKIIKSKKEAVNNKYDIREVFYINLKGYSQLRFLNKTTAEIFLSKLEGLNLK